MRNIDYFCISGLNFKLAARLCITRHKLFMRENQEVIYYHACFPAKNFRQITQQGGFPILNKIN